MIAKAILEMFTQLPGASRSTAQTSGQPFQAFSDSLIAATKSFSIGNSASDGSGKAGRRQRPASDDATASSEAVVGGAVPSQAASQQTQGTGSVVNLSQTRFSWSTVNGRRSTGVAAQFAQSLAAVGSAGSESRTSQTGNAQTGIVPRNIVRLAAVQSKLTAVQKPAAQSAATEDTPAGLAIPITQNDLSVQVAEIQSSVAETSVSRPAAVQSSFTPAQMPFAESTTTQDTSIGVAAQITQDVSAPGLAGIQSSVAQARIVSTNISQPTAVQSKFTEVQTPLAGSAKTQSDSTGLPSLPTLNVPAAGWSETESGFASTSTPQSADIQLNPTQVQTPLAGPATTQNTSTVVASQPTRNVLVAGWNETVPSVNSTNTPQTRISQPAAAQSNLTPAQMPLADSATTQNTSTVVASQSTWNVTAATLPETERSIASTEMSQPTAVQSKFTSVQTPFADSATIESTASGLAGQVSQNVSATELAGTQSIVAHASVTSTSIHQPVIAQSNVTPVQTPLAVSVTTQDTSTVAASEPAQTVTAAGLPEPELSISQAGTAQTSTVWTNVAGKTIVQPTRVSSSVSPLSNDPSQSSSKLPATLVQEMTAPITASPKSGNGDPSAVAATVSQAAPATDSTGVQDSLPKAAQNVLSGAVQSAVANDPVVNNQVPVVRAALIASAKDIVAAALKTDVAVPTNPQPVAADQTPAAAAISASGGIAEQLAALPLYDGSLGTIQTIVSSLKPVSAAKPQANASAADKGSSTDQTGLKKNAEPVSEAGSRNSSQDAPSSGNQSLGGNTPQAQDAAPLPINFASHPAAVIAPQQNTTTAASNHTSATPAGTGGVAARTTDNSTAHASTALPQSQPVINTAKLIQSMGQSEMRVGMRSNEFGNISISTSTSRDLVSAQISLEHGELAKTLAAHLPEMQARLGGNQPADVRIDMNGSATGQGTGSFGGTSNDSAGQSRSGRQPAGNMAQGQPGNGVAEQQFSSVAAAVPTGYARLDIRV